MSWNLFSCVWETKRRSFSRLLFWKMWRIVSKFCCRRSLFHISVFKLFLLQSPFSTIICVINMVNKIAHFEILTTCKVFCCHRPFSTSLDLFFPFFPEFVKICFCILYSALVTWFAVGYAAFAARDRDPAVYQTLLL